MTLRIILVGNLGRDPKLVRARGGSEMLTFSLAVNRGRKNTFGDWENQTTWYEIAYTGKDAQTLAGQLSKGREIMIKAGEIKAVPWKDQQGDIHAALHVKASLIDPLVNAYADQGYKAPEDVWSEPYIW